MTLSQPDDKPSPEPDASQDTSGAGSIVAAFLLGFLGFLSLLSTGCFGLFAFASQRGRVDGVFLIGMLFMAAVTMGFVLWCRAVLSARREKLLLQSRPESIADQPATLHSERTTTDE